MILKFEKIIHEIFKELKERDLYFIIDIFFKADFLPRLYWLEINFLLKLVLD